LIKERAELKKQLALETTQKRTSLGILFGTIKLYEKLANNTQTVHSFLKETKNDFKKLLVKVNK